jgi:hypothetical protein
MDTDVGVEPLLLALGELTAADSSRFEAAAAGVVNRASAGISSGDSHLGQRTRLPASVSFVLIIAWQTPHIT